MGVSEGKGRAVRVKEGVLVGKEGREVAVGEAISGKAEGTGEMAGRTLATTETSAVGVLVSGDGCSVGLTQAESKMKTKRTRKRICFINASALILSKCVQACHFYTKELVFFIKSSNNLHNFLKDGCYDSNRSQGVC